jgi:hypothetical protein
MKIHVKDLKVGAVVYDEEGHRYVIETAGNLAESPRHKDVWYAESEAYADDDGDMVTCMFEADADLWDNPNQQ